MDIFRIALKQTHDIAAVLHRSLGHLPALRVKVEDWSGLLQAMDIEPGLEQEKRAPPVRTLQEATMHIIDSADVKPRTPSPHRATVPFVPEKDLVAFKIKGGIFVEIYATKDAQGQRVKGSVELRVRFPERCYRLPVLMLASLYEMHVAEAIFLLAEAATEAAMDQEQKYPQQK